MYLHMYALKCLLLKESQNNNKCTACFKICFCLVYSYINLVRFYLFKHSFYRRVDYSLITSGSSSAIRKQVQNWQGFQILSLIIIDHKNAQFCTNFSIFQLQYYCHKNIVSNYVTKIFSSQL